jgi:hypothetical protein
VCDALVGATEEHVAVRIKFYESFLLRNCLTVIEWIWG